MFLDPTKHKEPPALTEVQQVLLGAAEYIEKYGWTQKDLFSYSGNGDLNKPPACAWGAIGAVAEWRRDVTQEANKALHDYLKCKRNVPNWNDAPGRTKDEVVAALRGAAQCS